MIRKRPRKPKPDTIKEWVVSFVGAVIEGIASFFG